MVRVRKNTNRKEQEMPFDPKRNGFVKVPERRDGIPTDGCYLRITKESNGRMRLALILSKEVADRAKRLFGTTCDVALREDDATIALYEGRSRKLIDDYGGKSLVNISHMMADVQAVTGDFKRLKCIPKVLNDGEAILVTPCIHHPSMDR